MKRIIKNNVIPYYSSYEKDRLSFSALTVLIRETRKRGYDVGISEISKEEVKRVESLDRWAWYKKVAEVGFFSLPENKVFRTYAEIYGEIKKRYKEKRKSINTTELYWLPYFYQKCNDCYVLKPKQEVMEILRSLPCPVYDDIEKKVFPETEKQKKLKEIIADYLALGNRYIPLYTLYRMLEEAGYSNPTNSRFHIRNIIRSISRRLGTDILVLSKNEELRFLLKEALAEYSKKFGATITRRELVKLSEITGHSRYTFKKASYRQLRGLCSVLGEKIMLVGANERRKEVMRLFEKGEITSKEAAEILSAVFLFGEEKMKILESLLEYKRLNRIFPKPSDRKTRRMMKYVLVS